VDWNSTCTPLPGTRVNAVQHSHTTLRSIKTAIRHTLIYGFGNVLAKAVGFLMLPLYTTHLTPKEYGILEMLDLSMSLLGMLLTLGLISAVFRCYTAVDSEMGRKRVVSTAFVFTVATGLVTLAVGLWLAGPLSTVLLGNGGSGVYVRFSLLSFILGYIGIVPRTYLRALEASAAFVAFETLGLFLGLALNVLFIAVLRFGIMGMLWSSLLVASLQTLVLSAWMMHAVGMRFESRTLKDLLAFGAPLMLANVSLFVLNFADRFFLQHFHSLEIVGVYAVGYKFAYMLNYLLVQPFAVMWQGRMFIIHKEPNYEETFSRIGTWFSLVLIYAGLLLAVLSPEIVRVMVGQSFSASRDVIPIVALSYVLYGLGYYAQLGLFLSGGTRVLGGIGGVAAAVNITANYVLIPRFGALGAAWATALAFGFLAVVTYFLAQRAFPLPLAAGKTVILLATSVALFITVQIVAPSNFVAGLAVKLAALVVFPALLWNSRMISAGDRDIALSIWRQTISAPLSRVVRAKACL
jgi:O-antigen/teichoic acid export membrane protein